MGIGKIGPVCFSLLEVVPEAGVEPARGATAHDFESCMTANSITPARHVHNSSMLAVLRQ